MAAASSAASDDCIIQATTSGGGISERREFSERVSPRAMARYPAPQVPPRRWPARVAQKLERWVFLYNVTTGLYMLDWWERCIFNAVFVVLFVLVGYNSGVYLQHVGAQVVAWAWWGDSGKELAGAGAAAAASASGG